MNEKTLSRSKLFPYKTLFRSGSLLLEEFEKNPFLKPFYEGKDFAVHSELQFILDRSRQLTDFFSKDHELIIYDYVPEKSLIFSKMNLSEKDYKIIKQLTNVLYKQIGRAHV